MKNILLVACLLCATLTYSQAFQGKGDKKFQIGANFQDRATGINATYDFGLGENISLGFASTYALDVPEFLDADFLDRFDFKGRFNAHLGNVINIHDDFDLYPGLDFSLKNFGGHLGARYFFTSGFGVFTEATYPIAFYDNGHLSPAEKLHNQFTVNFGMSFNL